MRTGGEGGPLYPSSPFQRLLPSHSRERSFACQASCSALQELPHPAPASTKNVFPILKMRKLRPRKAVGLGSESGSLAPLLAGSDTHGSERRRRAAARPWHWITCTRSWALPGS